MSAASIAATAVTVSVDGAPLTHRVLTVRVASRLGAPGQCEITLHDPAGLPRWPAPAGLNARLTVAVVGDPDPLFDGEITCVELQRAADGTTTARLRAYDRLHRLRGRQTLRVLENVDAAGVARALTGDLGMTVDAEPGGGTIARVTQYRQTDFDLLIECAARTGHLVIADGTTLRLITLAGYGAPVALEFGTTLFEVAVEANTRAIASTVTAIGWDTSKAEAFQARATSPRSGRKISFPVPAGEPLSIVEQPGASADEVTSAAQLALDLRTASAVVVRGVAAGDAAIRPGARVALDGAGDQVDGVHVVCEAVHTIGANGFQTSFSTEPPPAARSVSTGATITLGLVTDADDPSGRGRVRVSLPSIGDLDAGWLGVMCPGAGKGKGIVALPDKGDTVVVALPHADPATGLVLGSLFGALEPPDDGVDGGKVKRWSIRTDDGQKIVIDDDDHSILLENRDGSKVELAPDKVKLVAKTDLVIDASGHGITVRASTVDFEHAQI